MNAAEWAAQQALLAAWVQSAGLLAAALLVLAVYCAQAYRAHRRALRGERHGMEILLALARQARKLFYNGGLAFDAYDFVLSTQFIAGMSREGRELRAALLSLPLERLPEPALVAPLLSLRELLGELEERLAALSPFDAAAACRDAQRQSDAVALRIEALLQLRFGKPRKPLRRRCEAGMPSTAVDQYAQFDFTDELCLEADGVDFAVLVNRQCVLCSIEHAQLDALAGDDGAEPRDYEAIFRRHREGIERAAEKLIRAGARAPVAVCRRHLDSAAAPQPRTLTDAA